MRLVYHKNNRGREYIIAFETPFTPVTMNDFMTEYVLKLNRLPLNKAGLAELNSILLKHHIGMIAAWCEQNQGLGI